MRSVGLDIGSKTVKVVELEKAGKDWVLRGSGVVGYSGESPDKFKDEREVAALAEIIKKLFREANIGTKEVSLAVPESLVFTRTIKFPLLTDQEISSAIKWEAEQYIPIPAKEAVIQYQVLERRETSSPPEVIVLLVAAPRDIIGKYVAVAKAAGLLVTRVETELISLARSLSPAQQTALVVDFGAKSTDIAITKNSMLAFSRSIPTAGDAFTRAVSQAMNIQSQQAEEYKKAYGLSQAQLEGKIKSALDPVFRIVSDEIKKAVHFYQSEEKGEAPTSLILSGGTSGLPEAISYLTQTLGYEVVIGNPFSKVVVTPEVSKSLAPYAPLYSIAVGLALGAD